MSPEEFEQVDIGSALERMIEGTEFERKMDEKFERMLAAGMTQEQILHHMTKDIKIAEGDGKQEAKEIDLDPSKLNLDQSLRAEFRKMMEEKQNAPNAKNIEEQMQQMLLE